MGANWIRDLFSSFWEGLTNGGNGSVGFFLEWILDQTRLHTQGSLLSFHFLKCFYENKKYPKNREIFFENITLQRDLPKT